MWIRKVRLQDFRQFYGSQELVLSTDAAKSVTLIHAENGFGKTSILNAVLWSLFGQITPKFERPDDIVNYEALEDGRTRALVDVEFEFEKTCYLVQRTFSSDKTKTNLEAYRIDSGNLRNLNAPETFVASVIPPEMAKYFFFDGEAAESFAAARNYKEIAKAIRSLLGCSLAETAVYDLKGLCKTVEYQISETSGDARIERLEREMDEKSQELEKYHALKDELTSNISEYRQLHEEIVQRLRDMQGAQEIQRQRDEKQSRKQQVDQTISECRRDIVRWVGQRSIQLVSKRLSKVALDFVDEASLRGRIPSPYNEDFVRGLLQSRTCICHRPLPEGGPEWRAVAELLKDASNAEVLGRIVRARARLQVLREEAGDAPGILRKLQASLARLLNEQAKLEQEIAELGKKIENLPLQEIADRERNRRTLEGKIEKANQDLGGVRSHIARLEREKEALGNDLEELARKNKRTIRLLAKRQVLMRSISILEHLLEKYELDARNTIEEDVNSILDVVAHKEYRCRFNENFALELILNERATPKSGGENQLLSLAFIASLVKFAASRIDADDLILKPGTMAPLVLDAPLGQLDPSYQESVAEFLPKLARQVVLLVSGSQGGERVLQALQPFVGAEYLLVQENKGPRGRKSDLKRVFHGKEHDLILFDRPRTMTQIERLT